MKRKALMIMSTAAFFIFAGCSTTPVAVAPVGPNPAALQSTSGDGQLAVFSKLTGRTEGMNPTWKQYSNYSIYDSRGHRLEHVQNSQGHYSNLPRIVSLPPGEYAVVARAARTGQVRVPVVIKPGVMTEVHLDARWQPGTGTESEFVTDPEGYPIGWRANVTQ
jgi:hypothetical protein